MKPIWRGALQFGLVTIEIELYSAIKPYILHFNLLHGTCKTPITYHRWCDLCKQEVPWNDIVKGLQVKGSTVVIAPQALKKLKPPKNPALSIIEFVDDTAIDPILLGSHYYVVPSKAPYQAFFYFHKH